MEAGICGVRTDMARVLGLWLGPKVGEDQADRYPTVRLFRDRDELLALLPPTELAGFRPPRVTAWVRRWFGCRCGC